MIMGLVGRILFEIVGIWLFWRTAAKHLAPERYLTQWEKEYGGVLGQLLGKKEPGELTFKRNRVLGFINLLMAGFVGLFFLLDVWLLFNRLITQ